MFAPGAGRLLVPTGLLAAALATLGAFLPAPARYALAVAAIGGAAVFAFFAWFFRDPDRRPGAGIVSAADGHVLSVERDGDRWRISVFMNVTDVHVNRFPLDARVESTTASGRGFRPAYSPDAAHNVQRSYALTSTIGPVEVVQLTGLVARRLVPFVRPGDRRAKADRLGMIILGSRVDVYLPSDRATPVVTPGQRVLAGRTTIATEHA